MFQVACTLLAQINMDLAMFGTIDMNLEIFGAMLTIASYMFGCANISLGTY
jgi:hypothetical protein